MDDSSPPPNAQTPTTSSDAEKVVAPAGIAEAPLDPPADPRLVRALAFWEVGDVLSTREIIEGMGSDGLSSSDGRHYLRLRTATGWDRVHVWVGLALFIMWASLMFLTQ